MWRWHLLGNANIGFSMAWYWFFTDFAMISNFFQIVFRHNKPIIFFFKSFNFFLLDCKLGCHESTRLTCVFCFIPLWCIVCGQTFDGLCIFVMSLKTDQLYCYITTRIFLYFAWISQHSHSNLMPSSWEIN